MQYKLIRLVSILLTLMLVSMALANPSASITHQPSHTGEGSFDLSIGVRMKRKDSSSSSLHKRSGRPLPTEVNLRRDSKTGKFIWPTSLSEAVKLAKRDIPAAVKSSLHRRAKSVRKAMRVMITWYDGQDLQNPSCFPDSANWAPTDNSMVAAVTIDWPGKPKCGSFVNITHQANPSKYIVVRIVDSCGGCAAGSPHIDLTLGAFEKLYHKDVGLVKGLKATVIPSPVRRWSSRVVKLYGPKKTL